VETAFAPVSEGPTISRLVPGCGAKCDYPSSRDKALAPHDHAPGPVRIRSLRGDDAARCDQIITSLAAEGRRLLLVLTVSPSDPGWEPADGYQAIRAFYRTMGFILARDLPGLWPDDTAVLLVKPLAQAG
jgi:hypothetical protein